MSILLEAAVARLESVTARLEATEARLASITVSGTLPAAAHPASPVAAGPAGASGPPSPGPLSPGGGAAGGPGPQVEYQQLLSNQLAAAVAAGDAIGGPVQQATAILAEGFKREAAIVEAFGACKEPQPAELQQLLQPVGEKMMAAGDLASGPRSPTQAHLKLVSEAMQALSWVAYSGPNCGIHPPPQHVDDAVSAADFYANKVLMEWRAKDPAHVNWVHAVKALLQGLKTFCQRYYKTGPSWNPSGIPLSQFKPGAGATAAAPAAAAAAPAPTAAAPAAVPKPAGAGAPPPPPPPPPGSLIEKHLAGKEAAAAAAGAAAAAAGGAAGGGAMGALFAELNKGEAVTSGLRKVTADMKTKNRADRSGAVPAAASAAAGGAANGSAAAAGAAGAKGKPPAGPPRVECEQGRKWVIENQVGNPEIVIDQTEPKQTVYIYNCSNSTIQVRGKVNAITMDGCRRTGLLFDTVVATCELVNSSSVQVQCTGTVPTVSVDKCDGCQLYLPRATVDSTDITTAKSSEVNVVLPGATDDADPVESAIPEQFVSRFRGGKWVTEPVSHSGA